MAKKSTKRVVKFAPTAWQWKPESVTAPRVQFWSEGGSMSLVDLAAARDLVARRAAFVGADHYICQVHDRIDGVNA